MEKAGRLRVLAFWVLASTFVWALAVAPYVRRGIRDLVLFLYREFSTPLGNYAPLTQWSTLLTYPVICWTTALILKWSPRKGSGIFAIVHLVAGFVWIALPIFAAIQFGRAFRR